MNNILLNNQCKIVNIVWIDRGIILTLIYYITKKYNELLKKIIIINNKKYRNILKFLYPKLIFRSFEIDNIDNFYFNIRTIIKKKDIIIDYLNNYNKYIHANKLKVIPWYDMNDILISYEYNNDKKLILKPYKFFLNNFKCIRGNYQYKVRGIYYNQQIWDIIIENKILYKYYLFNSTINIYNFINNITRFNYTNTLRIIEKPKIYYIPIGIKTNKNDNNIETKINNIETKIVEKKNNNKSSEIDDDPTFTIEKIVKKHAVKNNTDIDELIKLITQKLNLVNDEIKRKLAKN